MAKNAAARRRTRMTRTLIQRCLDMHRLYVEARMDTKPSFDRFTFDTLKAFRNDDAYTLEKLCARAWLTVTGKHIDL